MDESKNVWQRFWSDPRVRMVLREVIVALLVALLTILGYDVRIGEPRVEEALREMQPPAAEESAWVPGAQGAGGGEPCALAPRYDLVPRERGWGYC